MNPTVIDLHDYLDMELVDRMILLQNNGVRIGTVETKLTRHDLYALGSFYVEVRTAGKAGVKDALPFLKGPRLDKYLDSVDLTSLLSS